MINKKIKICLFGGKKQGVIDGVMDYTDNLARELREKGVDVIEVVEQGDSQASATSSSGEISVASYHSTSDLLKAVCVAEKTGCSIVHIQYPLVAAGKHIGINLIAPFARMLGLRVVYTCHEYGVFKLPGKLRQIPSLLSADSVIVVDPDEEIRFCGTLVARRKTRTISIGCNVPECRASNQEIRKLRNGFVSADEKLGVFFGVIDARKYIKELLEAMYNLKQQDALQIVVVLIGKLDPSNDYQREIIQLIDNYGLGHNVRIAGYIPNEDVAKYLRMADFAILPNGNGASIRNGSFLAAYRENIECITSPPRKSFPYTDVIFLDSNTVEAMMKVLIYIQDEPVKKYHRKIDFGWSSVANAHIDLYENTLGR